MVSEQTIWSLLKRIPDPEIPVISIVDLGVVRKVKFYDTELHIEITPTYSGCPALQMMQDEIEKTLEKKGISKYKINTVLRPAWTTDWMSFETKEKLREYGIAPPEGKAISKKGLLNQENISCPQCGSRNTEIKSMFGSTACKAMYQCEICLEPFEYFKCI